MFEKLLFISFCALSQVSADYPPPCDSRVYCYGPLLHTVQMARIFPDSKTFVDMRMKYDEAKILSNFEDFMNLTKKAPTKRQVKSFVEDNFEEGGELERCYPDDFNPNPAFLDKIVDKDVKSFAEALVKLWPVLARKVRSEVIEKPERYSLLEVPNCFIIPGGRFREYYYWDSYWIIRGLLISEMVDTARGMIDNFIYIVKKYGFVPNGGRVYYLDRSQPPLLTKMALAYYKQTKNKKWLKENLEYFSQELYYWIKNKMVPISRIRYGTADYFLAHYSANSTSPRPESYYEDFKTASIFSDEKARDQLYVDIKSAAESGWDFSSRWFFDQFGGNNANLSHIETRRVIPVDLNAYLCEAFHTISYFYSEIGDKGTSSFWLSIRDTFKDTIHKYLWNHNNGTWYDFDDKLKKQRAYYYASNVAPLWTGCFDQGKKEYLGNRLVNYLSNKGIFDAYGGISTSEFQTGEQWDAPNAWPPLQSIVVQALQNSGDPHAVAMAKKMAEKWVMANMVGFTKSGEMFEKYDSDNLGAYGGGGEYVVQSGFGWSNGVALEFINDYYT